MSFDDHVSEKYRQILTGVHILGSVQKSLEIENGDFLMGFNMRFFSFYFA